MSADTTQSGGIGHYVYVYYDSDTNEPFYVGKGQNKRATSHQDGRSHNPGLRARLDDGNYGLDVLAWGLDQDTAFQVESAAIDLVGIDNLLNIQRGKRSLSFGRIGWDDLIRRIGAKDRPIERIDHNVVFVSINETYEKYGNTPGALYDSTRGIWKLDLDEAKKYDYIAGVVGQTVVTMYEVAAWLPAGTTRYEYRVDDDFENSGRIECVGREAPTAILDDYVGRSIDLGRNSHYFGPIAGKVNLNSSTNKF